MAMKQHARNVDKCHSFEYYSPQKSMSYSNNARAHSTWRTRTIYGT